jgi:hypothetical protein
MKSNLEFPDEEMKVSSSLSAKREARDSILRIKLLLHFSE